MRFEVKAEMLKCLEADFLTTECTECTEFTEFTEFTE
jgi:hypothetical protein